MATVNFEFAERELCGEFAGLMKSIGAEVRAIDPRQGRTLRVMMPPTIEDDRVLGKLHCMAMCPNAFGLVRTIEEIC